MLLWRGGGGAGSGEEEGDVQEDGPQQLQHPGQGPKTPIMIFLSGISAVYVILWHKIILLLMIVNILFILAKHCQKRYINRLYVRRTDRPSVFSFTKLVVNHTC